MSLVTYAAIVEGDRAEGYSAFFPDLPGCVTAAATMAELLPAARDALALHLRGLVEDGETPPEPTPLEALPRDPEVTEAGRLLVDVELGEATVRVNISLAPSLLSRIDAAAEARGMTRSGFLSEGARRLIEPTPGRRRA